MTNAPQRSAHKNIKVPELAALSWSTPQDVEASVHEAYRYAEARAVETIDWYMREKSPKARGSRTLRVLAIVLTTLGGLAPLVDSVGWLRGEGMKGLVVGQLGYLFLGLAAACVAGDKYFGYSSGWMRYLATAILLQKAVSEFRFDWAMMIAKLGGKGPTVEQVQLMLQRIKEFVLFVDAEVERETQVWIAEFQSSLAEIERTAKTQGEATRPGAIDVTVTNGMDAADGFTLSLDGMVVRTVHGTKYQIGYVPPGAHKIAVTGVVGGQALDASELVNVMPGAIATVTLALPVETAQP
jgi:hypothetical protein